MPPAMRVSRVLGYIVLASLGVLLLWVGLWVLPIPLLPFGIATPPIALTALIVGAAAMIARPCAISFERGRLRPWMIAGMLAALAAALLWVLALLLGLTTRDEDVMLASVVAALWCSGAALVLSLVAGAYRERVEGAAERVAAAAFVAATILCVVGLLWLATSAIIRSHPGEPSAGALLFMVMAPGAVVATAALLAVVRARARLVGPERSQNGRQGSAAELVRVRCPRCHQASALALGGAGCPSCGLRITVEVV